MMISFHNFKRIHFVGIGGIGMSRHRRSVANPRLLVSGSDAKISADHRAPGRPRARIFEGHKAENVAGAHVVVVSSAIPLTIPKLSRRTTEDPRHSSRRDARRVDAPEIRNRRRRRPW